MEEEERGWIRVTPSRTIRSLRWRCHKCVFV
jgi:hypothetical protein